MENKLNISIYSFSYKKGGIPEDNSEMVAVLSLIAEEF
jgi:hypothetical protein